MPKLRPDRSGVCDDRVKRTGCALNPRKSEVQAIAADRSATQVMRALQARAQTRNSTAFVRRWQYREEQADVIGNGPIHIRT